MRLVGRFRRREAVDPFALPSRPDLIGTRGADVFGVRPDGAATSVALADGVNGLLFLTAGCYGCRALWEGAAASGGNGPAAASGGKGPAAPPRQPPAAPLRPPPAPPEPALPPTPQPTATPLPIVIVTPSPATEDARLVASLAPDGIPVIMSSDGWHAYRVTRAPWYVGVVNGTVVADELAPESWFELVEKLARLGGPGATAG